MARNFMWGIDTKNNLPVHVVLFVSRHKDNKYTENYKERREAFITTLDKNSPYLREKF